MKYVLDENWRNESYQPPGPFENETDLKKKLRKTDVLTGSGTEKIFKGRFFGGLKGIWKVFFGNPPLEKIQGKT